jgi:hypothetical protein
LESGHSCGQNATTANANVSEKLKSTKSKALASLPVRWQLASAVYEVAYMDAAGMMISPHSTSHSHSDSCGKLAATGNSKNRKSPGSGPSPVSAAAKKLIAVPWLLCGGYLNQIKVHTDLEAMRGI